MSKSQIEQLVDDVEGMRLFQQERLILDATERICEAMEKRGLTRKRLADALGTSKSFISQLLDGSRNMTLRTLSDVFCVLGEAVYVHTGSIAASVKSPVELSLDVGHPRWRDEKEGWEKTAQESLKTFDGEQTEEMAA